MENDCDCLKMVAENIKEHVLATKQKKGFKLIDGKWEHQSFYPKTRLYSNYIIESTFEKVNGQTSRVQNSHMAIFYSHCPFCGKKYENKKEEGK